MNAHSKILWVAVFVCGMYVPPGALATSEQQCNQVNFQACLNGVGSGVSNGGGLRVSSAEYTDVARERAEQGKGSGTASLYQPTTTLAAGDDLGGSVFAVWASYSYNDFDSDFVFQGTSLAYDADAHNALAGFDRLFADRFLLGLAFGYQWLDSDSDFNGGTMKSDGFIIAPYAAVLLTDVFSIDLMGGWSPLEYDQNRISPSDGTNTSAKFDSDRWFIATNLNAIWVLDKWVLGAKVGYLYTEEEQEDYTERGSAASAAGVGGGSLRFVNDRHIDLSQIVVGDEIAYTLGSFEPYGIATYHNDLDRDDGEDAGGLPGNFTSVQPDDDEEVQVGGGIRYYTDWGLTTSLEYMRVEGREDFDSQTVMFIIRAAL